MDSKELFFLKILSLSGEIFSGKVYSFSSKNSLGDFDILKSHTNFITLLTGKEIRYRVENFLTDTSIEIKNGILIFEDDLAEVFINF